MGDDWYNRLKSHYNGLTKKKCIGILTPVNIFITHYKMSKLCDKTIIFKIFLKKHFTDKLFYFSKGSKIIVLF